MGPPGNLLYIWAFGFVLGADSYGAGRGVGSYGGQEFDDMFGVHDPPYSNGQNSEDLSNIFDPQKPDFDFGNEQQIEDFNQGQDDGQKWEDFDFGPPGGKEKEKYEEFNFGGKTKPPGKPTGGSRTTIPDKIFFNKDDFVPDKPKHCLEKPETPSKAVMNCVSPGICIATCLDGYLYPHGSKSIKLECRDGKWTSNHTNWSSSVVECELSCNPQCLNQGKCLEFNQCECPVGFKGPRCQYDAQTCNKNKLEFNGEIDCKEDDEKLSCKIHCPNNLEFESPAASEYNCYYSIGKFLPETAPKCIPVTLTTSRPIENITKPPTSGDCSTWRGSHYKTFDGQIYSFESNCSHTLVKHYNDVFRIIISNQHCLLSTCYRDIHIFYEEKEYVLTTKDNVPVLKVSNEIKAVPILLPGFSVERKSNFFHVSLLAVDVVLQWDGKEFLRVVTKENLWNQLHGLCGNLNGDLDDDFNTKEGQHAQNIETFVDSWTVHSLDENEEYCSQLTVAKSPCQKDVSDTSHCKLILNDLHFAECKKFVNASGFYEACLWDECKCGSNCSCDSVSAFINECKKYLEDPLPDWRNVFKCPIQCDGGKVYQSCGPQVQPTCGSYEIPEISNENECEEGCFCPLGKVLHDGQCIQKEECPCQWGNRGYARGGKIRKGCNTCTCQNGQWVCTESKCSKRCTAVGDPHYCTFDGKRYDFMGHCSYYLVKSENFSIEAENIPCPGFVANFADSIYSGLGAPSCTKSLILRYNNDLIKLKQNKEITVNGIDVTSLPFSKNGVIIQAASSIYVITTLPNKIQVWWDGRSTAYIDAPGDFEDTTQGLCGTFNGNQKDDFLTPEGDIEQSAIAFANKWKTDENCGNILIPSGNLVESHPCDLNAENKATAEKYCNYLKDDMFSGCHMYVDVHSFYENCLYDVCSCKGKPRECFCSILADYSNECAYQGEVVQWREKVRECGIHCSGGQTYQSCGNSCTRSCKDISLSENICESKCVEGCNCPEGYTLNELDECILISECPCLYHNSQYEPGEKVIMENEKGPQTCTCSKARWTCEPASEEEIRPYNETNHIREKCNELKNQEFTICEPEIPITCKNMHNPPQYTPKICMPGCVCKKGYVWDSGEKTCVKGNECPCHHGGVSYSDGDLIQEDCNTCLCKNGAWDCTNKECPGVCSVWGDSHFKTFDGRIYDFQGSCDFLLTSGKLSEHDAFDIKIQIVPCGSTGISCPKSISLKVGYKENYEEITLKNPLPALQKFKRISVRETDLFVFVDVIDLGIFIHWDKKTRVYVKVEPEWKGKLKGLCGNFNEDELDDFKTPTSGEISEVSVNLFVDSWRLQSYCPESTEIIDTCSLHPNRKPWAIEKCEILKSSTFHRCHTEIPVEPYYVRCITDACGCDQGGDCECLCSAIAAYSHECNLKGIPIEWRRPELCPIQCENPVAHYNSCVPTCPPLTCQNLYKYSALMPYCSQESCVEGCQAKPCPADHVYSDSSLTQCTPISSCKTVSICLVENDKVYYEGDKMESDNCQSCYCSHHEKICIGESCSPTTTTTVRPEVDRNSTDSPLCDSGEIWDDCIVKCNEICHSFLASVSRMFECSSVDNCVKGCRPKDLICPEGKFLRDKKTCVAEKDCPCVSRSGLFIEPGHVHKESECESCLCAHNSYECTNTCRESPIPTTTDSPVTTTPLIYTTVQTSIHPPCINGQYESLINNETKLSTGEDVLSPTSTSTQEIIDVWISDTENPNQFLQVDLGRIEIIYAVSVAGIPTGNHVTRYQISFSSNGNSYAYVVGDQNAPEIFMGPSNGFEFLKQILPVPIEARYVRFNPLSWHEGIAMKVDVLGCKEMEIQHPAEVTVSSTCDQLIGVGNSFLPLSHVSVSSEKEEFDVRFIPLNSEKAWQPLSNSGSEWVMLDFGQKIILDGVVTKGFADSWVDQFKVEYSTDGMSWNKINDEFGGQKLFTGNHNGQDVKYNYFKKSIRARYLKLIPIKWHKNIVLKLDVISCDNVEAIPTPIPPPRTFPSKCNVCDGIIYSSFDGSCLCEEDKWWDGEHCVPRAFCPCIVNHDTYAVGTSFMGENCQECICRFYGIPSCFPKQCPDCPHGLQKVFTIHCGCVCKPCPENSRLCPTSGTCLDKKYWCDKVQDCPDDELNCTVPATTIQEITTRCKSYCAPGYVMVPKQANEAFESENNSGIKVQNYGAKGGIKNKYHKEQKIECPPFDCVPVHTDEACDVPKCPVNHKIIRKEETKGLRSKCPIYTCEPYPVSATCNITSDSVNTFDGMKFGYEICDHVLAKDLSKHPQWEIKAVKICKEFSSCVNTVDIKHQNQHVLLYPESKFIMLNHFRYSFDQIILASQADFNLNLVGDSYVFTSKLYNFEVVFDKNFNIKVTLPQEMKGKVYGLCGLYDGFIEDDKTLPEGNLAKTVVEFGDGWMNSEAKECEKRFCPQKIQEIAFEICSVLKREPFILCPNINIDRALSHCIDSVCNCKLSNKTTDECRCSALTDFASTCKSKELLGWRLIHDCPSECPSHLVYHDCYPFKCEPTCYNNDQCLQPTESCFSGCFCPDGFFRKGDHCIKPSQCRDCACDGYGNSQYVTFNRKNFTFNGNCTYLATRDITQSGVPNFQVFITNHLCEGKNSATCTNKIDVYVKGHSVNLVSLSDNSESKSVGVFVDGVLINRFSLPFFDDWVVIEELPGTSSVFLKLPSYHLEVRFFFKRLAFTINLPSHYYKNKLEGFCGKCNKNEEDNIGDSERYMDEWIINNDREKCKVPEEKPCHQMVEETSFCGALKEENIFGECHAVIDPAPFLELCSRQLCNNESICDSFEAYAQACRDLGICLSWRSHDLCPYSCDPGTQYKPCELSCSATCENYQTLNETCNQPLIEGCFCPDDQILINDTCTPVAHCFACDDKGHRHGDAWQEDKCTNCTCEGLTKTCTKKSCNSGAIFCEEDEILETELIEGECCPREKCVCKPREFCEEISLTEEVLESGMHKFINESGCCPHVEILCRPETCPEPKPCRKYYLKKLINTTDCCPHYICEKPDDVCLFEYEFENKDGETSVSKLIGDRWMDGPCKSCICSSVNGVAEAICSVTNCISLEQHPDYHDYVLENITSADQCCPQFIRTGCKDGSRTYEVGDTWIPEETDLCTTVKCTHNSENVVEKVIHSSICKTRCDIGQEYIKSNNSCCGRCVQTGCVLDGVFYKKGQIWHSADNCTTFSCKVVLNTFIVSTYEETCPSLSNCPPENIYEDKCCKRCNLTVESLGDCSPTALPESKTVDLIKIIDNFHGKCRNIEPIPHFTECTGFCESRTVFQSDTWSYENNCRCCQIVDYTSRSVPLVCEDGFEIFKNVTVAEKCSCQPCNG